MPIGTATTSARPNAVSPNNGVVLFHHTARKADSYLVLRLVQMVYLVPQLNALRRQFGKHYIQEIRSAYADRGNVELAKRNIHQHRAIACSH